MMRITALFLAFVLAISTAPAADRPTLPASVLPALISPYDLQGMAVSFTAGGVAQNLFAFPLPLDLTNPALKRGYDEGYVQYAQAATPYVIEYTLPAVVTISRMWYCTPLLPADYDAWVSLSEPDALVLEMRIGDQWQPLTTGQVGKTQSGALLMWDFPAVTGQKIRLTIPGRVARKSGGGGTYEVFGWFGVNGEGATTTGDNDPDDPDPTPGLPSSDILGCLEKIHQAQLTANQIAEAAAVRLQLLAATMLLSLGMYAVRLAVLAKNQKNLF